MNNEVISAILLGAIPITAGTVVAYWHRATRGTWRQWPAGRSLMGLLGIITVGFAYGVVNRFLGNYPAKFAVAVLLYALFIGAIIFIGLTIRKETILGKAKANHPASAPPAPSSNIDMTVASEKEEIHD